MQQPTHEYQHPRVAPPPPTTIPSTIMNGSLHSTSKNRSHTNYSNSNSNYNSNNSSSNFLVTKDEAVAMVAQSASSRAERVMMMMGRVDDANAVILPVATATLASVVEPYHSVLPSSAASCSVQIQQQPPPPVAWCSSPLPLETICTTFHHHPSTTTMSLSGKNAPSTAIVTSAVPLPLTTPGGSSSTATCATTTTTAASQPSSTASAYIYNAHNGSIVRDSHDRPVTVERWLGTAPLRSDLLTRPGPGGRSLLYLSGAAVTRTLNDTFGFDGWHLNIVKTEQTVCIQQQKDEKKKGGTVGGGAWHVAYLSHVRVVHRVSGTTKEDIGAGDAVDKTLPTAIAHAIKASITDAMKRAARHFGDKLGNALYSNGKFTLAKAPTTLAEALDRYDQEQQMRYGGNAPSSTSSSNAPAPQQQQRSVSTAGSGKAPPPLQLSNNAAAAAAAKLPPPRSHISNAPNQVRVEVGPNCLNATMVAAEPTTTKFASSAARTTQPWSCNHNSSGQSIPPHSHQQQQQQKHYHSMPPQSHATPSVSVSRGHPFQSSTMGSVAPMPSALPVHLERTNPPHHSSSSVAPPSHIWPNVTTLEMAQYETQTGVAMTARGGPIVTGSAMPAPQTHRDIRSSYMPPLANATHGLPLPAYLAAGTLDKTAQHQQPQLRDMLNLPPSFSTEQLPSRPTTSCGHRKACDMTMSTTNMAPVLHGPAEATKKHKVNPYHTSARESDAL